MVSFWPHDVPWFSSLIVQITCQPLYTTTLQFTISYACLKLSCIIKPHLSRTSFTLSTWFSPFPCPLFFWCIYLFCQPLLIHLSICPNHFRVRWLWSMGWQRHDVMVPLYKMKCCKEMKELQLSFSGNVVPVLKVSWLGCSKCVWPKVRCLRTGGKGEKVHGKLMTEKVMSFVEQLFKK